MTTMHPIRRSASRRPRRVALALTLATAASLIPAGTAFATSQAKQLSLPSSYGSLEADVWRESGDGTKSGDTKQWDWQVTAKYNGDVTVRHIRATWQSTAALRNGNSISMGVGADSVSVGVGSNWDTVSSKSKYWDNDNGATVATETSNIVIGAAKDYRKGTISTIVAAKVILKGDKRKFTINGGV